MKKRNHYAFGSAFILLAFFSSSCTKTNSPLEAANNPVQTNQVNEQTLALATVTSKEVYNWHPGHYVLFNNDQDVVTASSTPTGFLGVQKKYSWKYLEPTKNGYDFSTIQRDLNGLAAGKYLVIQVQTKAFEAGILPKARHSERSIFAFPIE